MTPVVARAAVAALAIGHALYAPAGEQAAAAAKTTPSAALYLDSARGDDWPGYGRTFGQNHYSPLTQINRQNVDRLGLEWSMDLPLGATASQPIAVDGVLYFSFAYSVIHAMDAASGRLLWRHDPQVAERSGDNLRLGWGTRGISWWNGKIYTATHDGRLIALDASTGKEVWNVQVLDKSRAEYNSGAPRVFDGKVIIGSGGDVGTVRGQVSAYDAETGRQIWRFNTVPGNPADGFENAAMEMAAKTWVGEWWKHGGGGTAWNAISYDPDSDTVYVGTGNGYPWNRRVRSADQGDNLFLCSVIALSGKRGHYRWHYQFNPGETWDYACTMDMHLGEIAIDGKPRKVLMTAPKNGFFYVIDRTDGKLISAEPIAKVTWATHIDLKTGRPVETADARYPDGNTVEIWPSASGAHNWPPSAFSPVRALVYIPVVELGMRINDVGVDPKTWSQRHRQLDGTLHRLAPPVDDPLYGTGALLAWNPATQKAAWRVDHPTHANGGLMVTGGDLVFQGTPDGKLSAYDAATGERVWSFDARAPVIAPPVTYTAHGKQFVSVLTGLSHTLGIQGPRLAKYGIDPRTQARRMLTFALDGKATLPPRVPDPPIAADPGFRLDAESAARGARTYGAHCVWCHGIDAVAGGQSPDLRRSPIPASAQTFESVVRSGILVRKGMPRYWELTDQELVDLRQYLRTQAHKARSAQTE